ncbi:MAG: haloacid dehalogenase-like hydrolase [Polyangiaceae bacterium]|nr:haloacid dehalogenase-like hydrolase [Polyangiaceae bacterium]
MNPTVLLFDIDGTLLLTGGAGRRALVRAFEVELGRGDAALSVELRGMTDPAIFRAAAAAAGAAYDPGLLSRLVAAYLACLPDEVARAEQYSVLPGVGTTLAAARAAASVAVGLGTGNLERAARIKLGRAGLDDAFAFGGFGDDAEARAELLRLGAERGALRLGCARNDCRVVVIGDTPRDVEAARAIGAESVAVATGGYSMSELAAAGADSVHASLDAPGTLVKILGAAAAAG